MVLEKLLWRCPMIVIDKIVFDGHFSEACLLFVNYKRAIGYKYGARTIRNLRVLNEYFSATCNHRTYTDFTLTKEMVIGYTTLEGNESTRTRSIRDSLVRQFAIFLNTIGMDAYILPIRKRKDTSTFTPYIFSEQQIYDLFEVVDSLPYKYRSPNYHFIYPLLIRLLYGCGLRISEALTLNIEDIDFDEGILCIKQSKYNNTRLVPMSISLQYSFRKYMSQVNYKKSDTGFLFRNRWNNPYRPGSILQRFKIFLQEAGIHHTQNGKSPRLHDLRHTFAVHSLDHMSAQGLDTLCAIPYLSTYMGHRTVKCTEQYLRITPEAYQKIITALGPIYENLFPEVQ